jgi:fatty-acyl-CoA synthase
VDDIAYIARHGGDRFLIVDDVLLPLYEQLRDRYRFERVIVVPLTGARVAPEFLDYEAFIAGAPDVTLPELDEREAAGMCYTSGTTGRPKGVIYTHRSIVLHSLATAPIDYVGIGHRDCVCPVVPMFHANAWGLPHAAVMMGAKLAMPGPHLDGASLVDLYARERVTLTAGVPTIWLALLQALGGKPHPGLEPDLRLVCGGAAAPESMIRAFDALGLRVVHGWGMTETSPVGTVNYTKRELAGLDRDASFALRAKQGLPLPFFEIRAVNESGAVPWDGATLGELQVRGPWVASAYCGGEAPEKWTADGWFCTGDIVAIDEAGYVRIADRSKDLIKSGGEWVSSLDLENALMSHPAVQEAAVVGVPHAKWGERPLAVIVRRPGQAVTPAALHEHLAPRFASYCLPDAYLFVDAIPRSSTGKMLKSALRERYAGYYGENASR